MDERELASRSAALPEQFADRIPQPQLDGLRSLARGGEWGELVDALTAGLVKRRLPVTVTERDELAALANAMKLEMTEPTSKLIVKE